MRRPTSLSSPSLSHVKQAVDYAANQGVDWVLLTNGVNCRVYNVGFTKPISQELVVDIDFCGLNNRSEDDLESLYLLCKEGWLKSVLGDYHTQKQALSRFFLGALVVSDPVLTVIRRELRRLSPDVRIEVEQIKTVLTNEVIKREVIDGDDAEHARKKINRAINKALRDKSEKAQGAGERKAKSATRLQRKNKASLPCRRKMRMNFLANLQNGFPLLPRIGPRMTQ